MFELIALTFVCIVLVVLFILGAGTTLWCLGSNLCENDWSEFGELFMIGSLSFGLGVVTHAAIHETIFRWSTFL